MPWLFAFALALNAALVMLVQPLCARLVLPFLGGTPNVWNTCMLFFQTGLLAGYAYAHWASRWLGDSRTVILQVGLLLLGLVLLPFDFSQPEQPPESPTLWLLVALVTAVALPYAVMAGTGPLLQRWFARVNPGDPYVLFAASNAGSFLGLLAYPIVVEPWLTLSEQREWWRGGFAMLTALVTLCGMHAWDARHTITPVRNETPGPAPIWRQRLHWLLLAFAPSSLLLSVTNYLTTDIAAIPLLWVIPLALYLLTLTLAFARGSLASSILLVRYQPLAVIVLMVLLLREATEPMVLVLTLHLVGFVWLALVCHGELARTKPPPAHLTEFYLWLALGGALGGAFNTLVVPRVFSGFAEYPLMIALAAALRPGANPGRYSARDVLAALGLGGATAGLILLGKRLNLDATWSILVVYLAPLAACYALHSRPWRFGLAALAIFVASLLDPGVHGEAAYRERSFFGVHRVTEQKGFRRLVHGNTVHGQQFLDPTKKDVPLAYYHRTGPMGRLMAALDGDPRRERIGLVGLGAGSLAAYARPGERWTFFEIDPAVVHIARDSGLFTFLAESRGTIGVEVGDARFTLAKNEQLFGLLVIDAFGSDAIPWHLLTREALKLYRSRLQDRGILAFHISNRYVDLEPVLANHAHELGWTCRVATDPSGDAIHPGKMASIWLFMASPGSLPELPYMATEPGRNKEGLRPWTDDYANLLGVLQWRKQP